MKDNIDVRGARILVVDDSKTIRRSAENLLNKAGYEVCLAEDGFDALGKIVSFKPDLVFVDIMMPRLDGYHTCALIKSNPTLKHTPVVMLSSKDGLFDRAKGRLVGAQLYLSKPFTGEELIGAVRANLRPTPT
ncbi:response regulator [Thiocystis violacea]|uniref:response regulator n=1 Tax=Thiocystis violacea TaxID=13725 RepID=UPI0019080649|nr:response regulator [Thiocystis violacea]MBK1716152.1 pilus assembly protein PilG [Thiocystis violacea]